MNYIKKGTMMGATTFLLATAIGVGTIPQVTAYADTTKTPEYRNYYINNELQTEMYFIDGETFVPGVATAKAFGLKVDDSVAGTIKITNGGNEYVFKRFANYYTKNGEKVYIKETEQNGVKVPDSKTITKNNNGNLYIPVSFFENELGLKFGVDTSNNLYVGDVPNNGSSDGSKDTQASNMNPYKSLNTQYSTANAKKSISQGWVAPTLKSTSVDDLKKDAQTLIKELEFVPGGTQEDGSTRFAKFDVLGVDGKMSSANVTVVGPLETSDTASHFTSICFNNYRNSTDDYYGKADKIDIQVLKFYYPTSWEWIDSKLPAMGKASISSPIVERYTIDGRDTVIQANGQINIYMSKIGGSLTGKMLSVSSSGTIGSATAISNGSWTQSNGAYYFKDNSGNIQKGWVNDGGNWYYLDPSTGAMRTGWIQDGGNWYYCWSNGQMAVNTTVGGYKLGSNGAWVS